MQPNQNKTPRASLVGMSEEMNESTLRALLTQNGITEEDLLRLLKAHTPRCVDEQVESEDRFAKLESESGLGLNSPSAKNPLWKSRPVV